MSDPVPTPDNVGVPSSDALLIGFDFSGPGEDHCVLIVGRKAPDSSMVVVNAFQGATAVALYTLLVTISPSSLPKTAELAKKESEVLRRIDVARKKIKLKVGEEDDV
jgi:hypothetical protein